MPGQSLGRSRSRPSISGPSLLDASRMPNWPQQSFSPQREFPSPMHLVPTVLPSTHGSETWGQRPGSCEGLSAIEVRPLCAPLRWSLQSLCTQDTHLAPVRPVIAALALSCPEPSPLAAQHASCCLQRLAWATWAQEAFLEVAALWQGELRPVWHTAHLPEACLQHSGSCEPGQAVQNLHLWRARGMTVL